MLNENCHWGVENNEDVAYIPLIRRRYVKVGVAWFFGSWLRQIKINTSENGDEFQQVILRF